MAKDQIYSKGWLGVTSIQFLHCSFAGSYWIDCEVLEKKENFKPPLDKAQMITVLFSKHIRKEEVVLSEEDNFNETGTWYQIHYKDPNTGEDCLRWVVDEELKFPKFSEYNYG